MSDGVVRAGQELGRFLNVRSCTSPRFSHDAGRVYFLSNVTGVPEAWSVPTEGGWPEQHTFGRERVSLVACDPRAPRLIFAMDVGGSENSQLFLIEGEGATQTALGDDPQSIMHFGAFSPDGQSIAYASNQREAASFDVYVRELGPGGPGKPRAIVSDGGLWYAEAFHPDGEHLLVRHARDNVDADLYLVRLRDGEKQRLTPRRTSGPVRHQSGVFVDGGRRLFLLSDREDDFLRLWRLSLADAEFRAVDPGGWDVDALAGSATGRHLAYARNRAGRSELHIVDVTSEQSTRLEGVPRGVVDPLSLSVSTDGSRLAFSLSGDRDPADVFVVELPGGRPRAITHASRAGIPRDGLAEASEDSFETFDGRQIPVWTYRPRDVARPPCVVFVHGGPEAQFRPAFNPIVQYFVARGYAACAPNVRGSRGYGNDFMALDDVRRRPDAVRDLGECARWLAARPDVDGSKLAVIGGSYGGFMVLATLTEHPQAWAAGVDVVGVANWVTFLENTKAWRRPVREREYGSLEHDREFLESISPIHRIDQIVAPLLVVHGQNDPRVPVGEAEQVVAALRGRGAPVEYLCYPDEGHGIVKLDNRLSCYGAVVRFFDRHLSAG